MRAALHLAAAVVVASLATAAELAHPAATTTAFHGFTWDRVPLNLHFGKRSADLTETEVDFVGRHRNLIAQEKATGSQSTGAPRPASPIPRGASRSAIPPPRESSS